MGSSITIFSTLTILTTITIALLAIYVYHGGFWQPKSIPVVEPQWWGPGKPPEKLDTSIKPFKIDIPQSEIEELRKKLDSARLPVSTLEGVNFEYGFNSETLKKVVNYWKNDYDWRKQEKLLNRFPQYKTNIQGLDIHFLHVKPTPDISKNKKVVPLLLLHGWPGSVKEFYNLITYLNSAENDIVFEIVVPSLPGYGFSSRAYKPGLGPAQIAQVLRELMLRLNYSKFYVQGGDWGSAIGSAMSILYPHNIKGFHSNLCIAQSPSALIRMVLETMIPSVFGEEGYQNKPKPFESMFTFMFKEGGYMHLQATKPDTIGAALNDSPIGLAAYILEKFSTWTNPHFKTQKDGGLLNKFTYDDLLDNVMIYWLTNSITSSVRLYSECFGRPYRNLKMEYLPVTVPTACAKFMNEIMYQSDAILKHKFVNLIQSHEFQDGGHFAAMEVPNILAKDILEAIRKMEKINH